MKLELSEMHTEADQEKLLKLTYAGFEISSHYSNQAPIPWDAEIIPEFGRIIIEGGVGPNGFGGCTIVLAKNNFHKAYHVDLDVRPGKSAELIEYLTEIGIKVIP